MLNQRQIEILLELCKNPKDYLTASHFSKKQNVSLRTTQNDIKQIKDELANEKCARIISVVPKGCCIQIEDYEEFSAFVNTLYQQYAHVSFSYPTSRVNQIIMFLLNKQRAVSVMMIAEQFFISHSTLLNDLKSMQKILDDYNLELFKSGNRLLLDGSEVNKRRYLVEKNMYLTHTLGKYGENFTDEKQITNIKNILTETLVKYKYNIADTDIQNAILVLNITIKRLQNSFYIKPEELVVTDILDPEKEIAQSLFASFEKRFLIKPTEDEINYFALYLKGQASCQSTNIISVEMDEFVLNSFKMIRQNFGIDFTDNLNLRIALALHCIPLSIRIKYNMQLRHNMLDYIRQTFPLGYDIGMYFSLLLEEKYGQKISDAEISLIAIHFYSCLLEVNSRTDAKQVLVISSLKNSMTILLRQTLLKWFSNDISVLDFKNSVDVCENDLDYYDIFLTTEKGEFYEKGMSMLIDVFPSDHDYMNIKLIMDGFENIGSIIQIFCEELFFSRKAEKKEKIISTLCTKASEMFVLESLYDEIMSREKRGSTYFGNRIAVPHPMYSVSSDTFIAVYVTNQPIEWDEDNNTANLVIMVCIGKNNPQAFKLWDYIAKIFADDSFVDKILEEPTYTKFISLVKESLKEKIQEVT